MASKRGTRLIAFTCTVYYASINGKHSLPRSPTAEASWELELARQPETVESRVSLERSLKGVIDRVL